MITDRPDMNADMNSAIYRGRKARNQSNKQRNTHPNASYTHEPRCEKTGLRGFRPGPTQTGLYNYTNSGFMK